jgi:hypothetical protein
MFMRLGDVVHDERDPSVVRDVADLLAFRHVVVLDVYGRGLGVVAESDRADL